MAHEILIVDDEPDIRLLVEGILRDEGYETRQAGDVGRGDRRLPYPPARRWSCSTSGCKARSSTGSGILQALHRRGAAGAGGDDLRPWHDRDGGRRRSSTGAYDFIEKPFQSDRLLLVVRRALEAAQLARENAELRLRAGPEMELTGEQPA